MAASKYKSKYKKGIGMTKNKILTFPDSIYFEERYLPSLQLPFICICIFIIFINPLSASFTKWSNTLKQFVGKLPTNCLSVFDHFVGLALKGLSLKMHLNKKFTIKSLRTWLKECNDIKHNHSYKKLRSFPSDYDARKVIFF